MDIEASDLIDSIIGKHLITQKEIAKMCGVSTVHLCNVYNGNKKASKTLTNLLKLLNKSYKNIEILKGR